MLGVEVGWVQPLELNKEEDGWELGWQRKRKQTREHAFIVEVIPLAKRQVESSITQRGQCFVSVDLASGKRLCIPLRKPLLHYMVALSASTRQARQSERWQ